MMFDRQSVRVAALLWGGIWCLIAAHCIFFNRYFDKEKRRWMIWIQLTSSLLLFIATLVLVHHGVAGETVAILVRIGKVMFFILSAVLIFLFHGNICCYLFPEARERLHLIKESPEDQVTSDREKIRQPVPKRRIIAGYFLAVLAGALTIISLFMNFYHYMDPESAHHRVFGHIIFSILPICGMVLDLSLALQYRKRLTREMFSAMLLDTVLPLMIMILLLFYHDISLTNIAISIPNVFMFVMATTEQNQKLARKEQEAADLRISIMVSQIQPHFIYNSLNTIYHLCDKDTALAKEAISDFSDYLQPVLKSVNQNGPVLFTDELEHVRAYLNLEKIRFGDDLNIKYDIAATNFLIPALSIQPLAENAVKHGICRKEDGGTLTLSTRERTDFFEIKIADDGIGFDPEKIAQDGKLHIGIWNVKQRLYTMCGATLKIKSSPGEGTIVVVHVPKDQKSQKM